MTTTSTTSGVRDVAGRIIPEAGTYALDVSHTTVGFVVRHLMISKVRGGFTQFAGEIQIADKPEDSSVTVDIDTASIDTRDSARDAHLRGEDFFDVERYPTLSFRSTSVRALSADRWEVDGALTIKDVTRPVVLEVEFEGAVETPWGEHRIGFSASTDIDRDDWGLSWNQALETGGFVVGKKVRIEVNVEATRV